jgi:hypothetical protein
MWVEAKEKRILNKRYGWIRRKMMKVPRTVLMLLTLAMLGAALTSAVRANQAGLQDVSKKTTVTLTRPMEIPGQVLQPGTYVFRVMDIVGTRNIMQITNADETKVFATIIAVPDYRVEPTEKSVVQYKEEAAGKPNALRAWFYGHEKAGLEFVYPKKRAVELAEVSHELVPAETGEATTENLETTPLVAITPEGKEEPIAQAFEQKATEPTEVAQALPKTASSIPLIALVGGMLVAAGFGLKKLAKLRS